MIFKLGQIIGIGVLGGAGGYLIYKSKPSTKRIEAEYYEKLQQQEEEKLKMNENGLTSDNYNTNTTLTDNITTTNNNENEIENPIQENIPPTSNSMINSIKTKTNQLKSKIQEKAPKIIKEEVNEGGRAIQRNKLYSNFYENYRKSNEMLIRGKENAGLRRRYEDIKRIHNYCRNNNQ